MKRSMMVVIAFAAYAAQVHAARDAASLTLTEDGKPRATIVLAAKPTQAAAFAAIELRDHLKKITGAELPVVPDTAAVTGPRILVGESAATRALGLRNKDFKPQEYLIRLKGDNLVLMGCDADKPFGLEVRGQPQWTAGKFGKALAFDGAHDGLRVMVPIGFDDNQGSMEAWIKPAVDLKSGIIFRLDGDPWSYHIVSVEDGRLIYTTYDGKPNGGSAIKSEKLAPGWHHVLVTWDAAKGRKELFVDGRSAGTAGYTPTHCADAPIQIGAMNCAGTVGAWFKGAIDEVRFSNSVGTPTPLDAAPADDAATLAALHFDEGAGLPHPTMTFRKLVFNMSLLPDSYNASDAQGTCYAVYHFLERSCGVRWYGPTDICTVYSHAPTFTVPVAEVRRVPSFVWRNIMPVSNFAVSLMPTVRGLWGNPSKDDLWLYRQRMRNGGEQFGCGHSFYGYYDRFRYKNPKNPSVWEGQHLEWFADGYDCGLADPQMCYHCEDFISQVITDAGAFFDGKRPESNGSHYWPLGPMDNDNFCKCPLCKKTLVNPAEAGNKHFTNGKYSDYWFDFCNKIARGIRQTHPDKYVATLAYANWAKRPQHVRLEPNVAIQLCLAVNNYWDLPTERNEMAIYREWLTKEKGRRIYLWLYAEFPEAIAGWRGFTAFPGFGAHLIGRQMKMYYHDGVRGLMPEGITTQLNEYLYNELAFDATQDPDKIINEFFTLYYGAAAAPMRQLWTEIEETYQNPANYPQDIQTADTDVHQTEEMAWKYLGTTERLQRWAGYMEQAKRLAQTDVEKARVALFEHGEWESMVTAKKKYDAKSAHQGEVDRLQKSPPLTARLPKLAVAANGALDKVDWTQGTTVKMDHDVHGYPVPRQAAATVAHDAKYLYLRLEEQMDTKKLSTAGGFWPNDDWEIFLAAQRAKPYRQIQINPQGQFAAMSYGESEAWDSGVRAISDVKPDRWTVRICLPLAHVLPHGLKSGQKLYLNVIRSTPGGEANLALSPNFSDSFHELSRLAEFQVE